MKRLLVLIAALCLVPACAGGALLGNPLVHNVVADALAWIGLIDSVVQSVLGTPGIPAHFGEAYQALRLEFAQAATVVADLVQLGEESQAATIEAIEQLQAIGQEIVDLLGSVGAGERSGLKVPEPRFGP